MVLGTPPTPGEDPFFVTLPYEELEEVPASGELTEWDGDSDSIGTRNLDDEMMEEESIEESQETYSVGSASNALDSKARDVEPIDSGSKTAQSSQYRCFSCIEICRSGLSVGDTSMEEICSLGKEELCGWGTSSDIGSAKAMAQEQCRATVTRLTDESQSLNCPSATCI